MTVGSSRTPSSEGRISSGLKPRSLIEQTLSFVTRKLSEWRDHPDRKQEKSEERLNAQLCEYLNVAAGLHLKSMVHFSHEKKQTGGSRVDWSAQPTSKQLIASRIHSIFEPFLVFEGKRLPAPAKKRQREYLTGNLRPDGTRETTGGVQRFKLGLHGAQVDTAALIGYVQKGNLRDWHDRINRWLTDLATDLPFDVERWKETERFDSFQEDSERGISTSRSKHARGGGITPQIELHHLWVLMSKKSKREGVTSSRPRQLI